LSSLCIGECMGNHAFLHINARCEGGRGRSRLNELLDAMEHAATNTRVGVGQALARTSYTNPTCSTAGLSGSLSRERPRHYQTRNQRWPNQSHYDNTQNSFEQTYSCTLCLYIYYRLHTIKSLRSMNCERNWVP